MHRDEIQDVLDGIALEAATSGPGRAPVDVFARAMREVDTVLRRRRIGTILVILLSVAGAGVGYWFERRATAPPSCARLIGPIDELSRLAGRSLKLGHGFEIKGSHCEQAVEEVGGVGMYVLRIEVRFGSVDSEEDRLGEQKFADTQTVATALGDAVLFVAGDAPEVSGKEILANAQRQVGRTRDPMGAALAALPPSQHVAIMNFDGQLLVVRLWRKLFTPEQARAYAIAVAQRARQPAR